MSGNGASPTIDRLFTIAPLECPSWDPAHDARLFAAAEVHVEVPLNQLHVAQVFVDCYPGIVDEMNVYGDAATPEMAEAQGKVVRLVLQNLLNGLQSGLQDR